MKYKYEMHCHTKHGSRQCGRTEPREIARLYKEAGFSGVVLTDHYSPLTFDPAHGYFNPKKFINDYVNPYYEMKKYEDSHFSVMFGMEIRHYGTGNDYLIYGVDPEWLREQGNLLAMHEKKLYKLMHDQGYLVYQAHPFRPYITRCNPKYLDGVEIYNGKTPRSSNEKAEKWAKKNGLLMISGSDFHIPAHTGRGGILTSARIRNNADLLTVLKSQNFEMIKTY